MSKKMFKVGTIFSMIDRFTKPLGKFGVGLNSFSKKVVMTGIRIKKTLSFKSIQNNMIKIGRGLKRFAIGAAAVTATIGGLSAGVFALAHSTAKSGDIIAKTAREIGINAEALQEYRHAANLAGIEQKTFDDSLRQFSRRIGDFANKGIGPAKDAFNSLGISIRDSEGNLKGNDQLLMEVSKALEGVSDASVKASISNMLFGRSGLRMANFLEQGSDAIQRQRDEARELGMVLSEDTLKNSEYLIDSIARLQGVFTGLKNMLGAALIPGITKLVVEFKDFILSNKELISSGIGKVFQILSRSVKFLLKLSLSLTNIFSKIFDPLLADIGPMMGIFDMLGSILIDLFTPLLPLIPLIFKLLNPILGIITNILPPISEVLGIVIEIIALLITELAPIFPLLSEILVPVLGLVVVILKAVMPILRVIIKLIVMIIDVIVKILLPVIKLLVEYFKLLVKPFEILFKWIEKVYLKFEKLTNIAKGFISSLKDILKLKDIKIGGNYIFDNNSVERQNVKVGREASQNYYMERLQKSTVDVNFNNLPSGTKVYSDSKDDNFNYNMGYSRVSM